ncbi:glycosyltransferase family 39 protein [Cyclobacterium sp.]|uniref:ArnT family glycosyltransferase n=1 Tax=Cyclobacterium sp. TaxID=1966343 RepID=UPI00199E5898|nr:glycosyltransferase family 39 protein [Cyclobacterium sp.]MBD3628577.1 glycosyltransferase family 39 protein [Cyclobacterium sp.]
MATDQAKYSLNFWLLTLGLAVTKILFTLRPEINLFTEEAHYWLWSRKMAWHYYSKPPLVAVLNLLSTSLMGHTEIAVRLNAILSGIGVAWITFLFGSYLYSKKVGFWSAAVIQGMPFWWLASTFHVTDSSLTFFWILTIYFSYRAIKEEKKGWWVAAGIATAAGLMAKLVMALIYPALFLFLFYNKKWNSQQVNFLIFFSISSLGLVPLVIWNWQNHFDTFKHLAALAGADGIDLKHFEITDAVNRFIIYSNEQLAIISLLLLPSWLGMIYFILRKKNAVLAFLVAPGISAFLLFACLSLIDKVNINWPAFAYCGFAIALGKWMELQTKSWNVISKWGIFLSIGLPVIFLLPDFAKMKSNKHFRIKEQKVIVRLLGHRNLAERIDYLKDSLAIREEFIFSDSYHTASELSFYLSGHPQTYVLNMGSRKNQFDLWNGMEKFIGQQNTGIFVSWNFDSMEGRAIFQQLIHEESFLSTYHGIPRRAVKIQIWKNLLEYRPNIPSSY